MIPQETCRHCKRTGDIGRSVQPYYLGRHSSGEPQIVWLHREPCSATWHDKWRAWMAEKAAA